MYIPNMKNDGHDTGVSFANTWYVNKFFAYLNDAKFMERTVLVSTFDESKSFFGKNQIYTSIVGPDVSPASVADPLTIVSLLKLLEDNWSLGDLGKGDATANSVPNIWK
jgi:hypothetical protein